MRFDSLDIPAFGPFTGFGLEFPSVKYDVHLIYGQNEAGKSSLLRAINQLFFGIPSRTGDNFLHGNTKLLIGAAISDGSNSLTFFRKKGNKNTLLDAGQNTLADSALDPFLGSVNEEFFSHMFGLDTESLRAGAADLLSGKGDLGTILFSASLGGSPIDDAIKKLETEANSLCKGASKKDTTILPAIAIFKEAEKAARAESTTATAWKTLKSEVKSAEESFAAINLRHREQRARWQFVDACLRALPVLDSIRRLESELVEIEAPELPSDFPQRVRELQSKISRSQQTHQLQEVQIEKATSALKAIPDPTPILAATADFEILHRRAEQYLENLEELPSLEARLTETDIEKLPAVSPADQALLKESAATLTDLTSQSAGVTRDLENIDVEIAAQKADLTEASDLSELEDQVDQVDHLAAEKSASTKLEKDLAAFQSRQESLTSRLEITGDPTKLKIPGTKTIQAEAREHERLISEIRELESRLADLRDTLADEQSSLDHLASQASIFTQADLADSREERDAIWEKIIKSQTIQEGLTGAILRADEVADTLHDHADHLATAAGHQAKIIKLSAQQKNLQADLTKAQDALEKWSKNWRTHSENLTPIELIEWREEWDDLCGLIEESFALEATLSDLRQKEEAFLNELGGDDFSKVHRSLKAALHKAHQEEGERKNIRKELSKNEVRKEQLTRESKSLAAALTTACAEWKKSCAATSIDPELPSAAAVEELAGRAQNRDLLLDFQTRSKAVADFELLLAATAKRFNVEASELVLADLHDQAKIDQNRAQTLEGQLEQLQETFPQIELAYASEKAELESLIKQADSEDLESVILQIESRRALDTRLTEQKSALQNFAGTRSLEEFIASLEEQDSTKLAEEKETLDQAEETLQKERDESRAALDEHLRRQAEMMEASDLAASQKQAAADALATIVADTGRFRQLHYAIDFLKQQVEDYRQKTQGPMIEKTSSFFQSLTGGAFEKVAAQLDEKNVPQLIAIRSTGESVPTGGLSEGTADQLYLALRLAAIDLHLENHPPIPLILDDLLMTFDDERTRALLPVLEKLSEKTQVLIFTHHAHLRELVGKKVTVHQLP